MYIPLLSGFMQMVYQSDQPQPSSVRILPMIDIDLYVYIQILTMPAIIPGSNNNNNNCLKSNIQCIEIRVQWTVHLYQCTPAITYNKRLRDLQYVVGDLYKQHGRPYFVR